MARNIIRPDTARHRAEPLERQHVTFGSEICSSRTWSSPSGIASCLRLGPIIYGSWASFRYSVAGTDIGLCR
jgi:hypothetical protein